MRKSKKFLYLIAVFSFLVLFVWTGLSQQVSAASKIDTKKPVSITIGYDGKETIDTKFKLYHIANVKEDGTIVLTKTFEKYAVSLNNLDDDKANKTAAALVDYIARDKISSIDSGKIDSDGKLEFPTGKKSIYAGVYLIVGDHYEKDGKRYEAQPMLIGLPYKKDNKNFQYHMEIAPKGQIENKTTKITVVKIWKEETKEYRPSEIEVQLINKESGKIYSTVTLNKKNNWRYTWEKLPMENWSVVEKEVPKYYTVTTERDDEVVILTNKCSEKPPKDHEDPKKPDKPKDPGKKEPPKEKLPQTGTYWWPVPIMAGVGIFFITCGLVWRRYDE